MKPLKFRPLLKSIIWGGEKIAPYKGITTAEHTIGESWELSGVKDNESVVDGGEEDGKTLPEMIDKYKGQLVGEKIYKSFGNEFPLLIKFIDAQADLSIQVHPNDELSFARHGKHGKTEMWYVVDTNGDAHLKVGFDKVLSPEKYADAVENHTIADYLRTYKVENGDVFFLPAGRVHAICAGSFVAEIQQTSDVTYRIYDYGRLGKDGKPRELHTALAKDAINFNVEADYQTHYLEKKNKRVEIATCKYFTTSLYDMDRVVVEDLSNLDSFLIVMCIGGKGEVVDNEGNRIPIHQGQTILVPASTTKVTFVPDDNLKVLTSYI